MQLSSFSLLTPTHRQALVPGEVPRERLASSTIEQKNVFEVYDTIALHWHHTRGKRKVHWHRVKDFLLSIAKGSLVADVGSGDGKYFGLNEQIISIGCDRSLNLLQVSKDSANETFCCDAVKLPLRSDCFDATLCIALLHHLGSVDRRVAVIRELLRITKMGGSVLLQAWAMEQGDASKRQFSEQDVMVPWRLQKQFHIPTSAMPSASSTSDDSPTDIISLKVSDGGIEEKLESLVIVDPKEAHEDIVGVRCHKKSQKSKSNKKVKNNDVAIDRSTIKKPYRTVNEVDLELETSDNSIDHRFDGRDQLITYERYCHVYRKGELEDLCSSIPCCRVVEAGWDRSNWFVQIQKVEDPRIVTSTTHADSKQVYPDNADVNNKTSNDGINFGETHRQYDPIGIGVPQPLPSITLRTL